ncbi:MAG TPA: TonB family protein [Terracidiphilus sp.]|jgi:TonB family protein
MRTTLAWICFLIASMFAAPSQEPVLIRSALLQYPPLARAARVSGTVKVEFQIKTDGLTDAVTSVEGPALLRRAAEDFVESWKFDPQTVTGESSERFSTTIVFKAAEGAVDPRNENTTFEADGIRHFEITMLVSDITMSDCPTGTDENVPESHSESDYVEVSRSSCYGTCPAYTVRVNSSGLVSWTGHGYVIAEGDRTAMISADTARELIEKFRTAAFWSYCRAYTRSITDNPGTQITVSLGGHTRTISDYAKSSPKELLELLAEVDRVSNSHQWRHGDPTRESISMIRRDSYLPKPGVTPLMLAAGRNEMAQVKALIAVGEDVKAVDSSGWTALMYAAYVSSDFPVQELLKAGADPNQSSPHGDTALMVSALSGFWNGDLVKAGAEVNSRNQDGQTALMILATRADADEIAAALKDGADAFAEDKLGRTALAYLRLANCGKNPFRTPELDNLISTKCDVLDSEDLKKTKVLLTSAMRAHR